MRLFRTVLGCTAEAFWKYQGQFFDLSGEKHMGSTKQFKVNGVDWRVLSQFSRYVLVLCFVLRSNWCMVRSGTFLHVLYNAVKWHLLFVPLIVSTSPYDYLNRTRRQTKHVC